ncbi:hypothetical protein NB550_13140 [Vibrio parahaemolyticus]|uniref:hypothetical protein n=1 Tax=Vibrio TaxID=662 RepID=UPI0005028F81|nr:MULTISPECIES: hypothetical protein [Vibrio]EHR0227812.1 hypothetical protein [Vibrio parahaemolyticus]EKH9208448.1 hypothetical protein [Vibrio parahaemolyticus]KFI12690.1 hypothetical protein IX95_06980 [Vibrio sp. B183]MCR9887003.1 hypothetical protein [Vibrio parahaemolyticus]MCR9918440.1 hypothetical protein [Vibrio parahaemolyticus]
MKMAEKVQAVNEIFLSTTNQEKFLETYGFEALKKVQAKLNSLIENQEEHYKKLAEEEAERLRKAEEEAKAKLEAQIEALKPFAALQLPESKQGDESAVRAKAEELLSAMSKPQPVEESATKTVKEKTSKPVYKFYTVGGTVERTKSNPDQAFKAALTATGLSSKEQWQLLHEDSIEAFIDDESPKPQVSKKLIQSYRDFFAARNVEELLAKLK